MTKPRKSRKSRAEQRDAHRRRDQPRSHGLFSPPGPPRSPLILTGTPFSGSFFASPPPAGAPLFDLTGSAREPLGAEVVSPSARLGFDKMMQELSEEVRRAQRSGTLQTITIDSISEHWQEELQKAGEEARQKRRDRG